MDEPKPLPIDIQRVRNIRMERQCSLFAARSMQQTEAIQEELKKDKPDIAACLLTMLDMIPRSTI